MNANVAYKRASTGSHKSKINTYLENQILNSKPEELVLKVYDFILLNIKKKNYNKANAGIIELIAALNFDYQDVSLGLFKLYTYCQNQIRKENWTEAQEIIQDIRNSWAKAFNYN
jgi:flagellar protein FliS